MKCKVIINACSPAFLSRAEEAASFLQTHRSIIDNGAETEEAVVFYADENIKAKITSDLPFRVIHLIKIKHYQPELVLDILTELEKNDPADIYLFPGDFSGNELAVRFARRFKGSSLVAVENIAVNEGKLSGIKKVYSGNLRGSFLFRKKPYCFSLAKGLNRLNLVVSEDQKTISSHDYSARPYDSPLTEYLETMPSGEDEVSLEKANFMIAVGRGTGSSEEISRLKKIARGLGAELGVSRPVVMNAWAPMDRLIGASGSVVSPEICLALAVSGSPPFYYGIEKSKKIIAVNHDDDAPIIKAADLVIVEDYKKVMDALLEIVREERS